MWCRVSPNRPLAFEEDLSRLLPAIRLLGGVKANAGMNMSPGSVSLELP